MPDMLFSINLVHKGTCDGEIRIFDYLSRSAHHFFETYISECIIS